MLGLMRKLRQAGVLGINERNATYIMGHNPRARYHMVDDKLVTKRLALEHGIDVPTLYGVVQIYREIRDLPRLLRPYDEFVIKPAQGSQGEGILVVAGRAEQAYRKASGQIISELDVQHHTSNILSGIYSLGGQPDQALIEYRVQFDPVFEEISYLGVPDMRIIVFLGVPVMAMVRLPTRMSDGKANLHQGAIGAGIDIADGRTLTAVWQNSIVERHPDTGAAVSGLQIPHWGQLLEIAARSFEMTGLGYQGVDIVLDKVRGPLVLELNARPGLNIQLANRAGLRQRLDLVQAHQAALPTIAARVDFARTQLPRAPRPRAASA